ncbi:hypothetical protein [Laceyella putida]|uniref:Uncharacterized protein n=1 Tax=Laceyella putida TaxID=110101 RepID=A0ABW2RKY2_9BACL
MQVRLLGDQALWLEWGKESSHRLHDQVWNVGFIPKRPSIAGRPSSLSGRPAERSATVTAKTKANHAIVAGSCGEITKGTDAG